MDSKYLYDKLIKAKNSKNLSDRKLCDLAGVSHSVLYNWQYRQVIPSVAILDAFCYVLEISLSELLQHDNVKVDNGEKVILQKWALLKAEDKKVLLDLMRNLRGKYGI